jgi:hypothetical protein
VTKKKTSDIDKVLNRMGVVLSDRKPTKAQYLARAKRMCAALEVTNQRHIEITGEPLASTSASHRFLGKSMWRNLMGWAGFPLWYTKDEL